MNSKKKKKYHFSEKIPGVLVCRIVTDSLEQGRKVLHADGPRLGLVL
jgi:hypothetical protein